MSSATTTRLETWLDEWLQSVRINKKTGADIRDSTKVRYRNIVEAIQASPISAIKLGDLLETQIQRHLAQVTEGSRRHHYFALNVALRRAVKSRTARAESY